MKREVWEAFRENPSGVEYCVHVARAAGQRVGQNGGGLLVTMLRRGDHLLEPDPTVRRVTGWTFVRGTHSGSYRRDPAGTDPLPAGYQ